ncbi:MAG: tail fiber protein [Ferruginibacter sp.]
MDPFVAEVRLFACNFAPRGWAQCMGQILPIAQNTALFSLVGTLYGGDGRTTFGLPNLQGQVALGQGQGPGLSPYQIGEVLGSETVSLLSNQGGTHTHSVNCSTNEGTVDGPKGNVLATSGTDSRGNNIYTNTPGQTVNMNPNEITPTGGGGPHNNMSPYLTLNYCIALQGVFPQRQ